MFEEYECRCCGKSIYILDDDKSERWYCDECEKNIEKNEVDNLKWMEYYQADLFYEVDN